MSISSAHLIARLFLSAILGGFIGLEREAHGRPAGLRTHILVATGSCLIMLLSVYGFGPGWSRDPARLAAGVISGIGFLGAGTILREGSSIKGLTTAASLWVIAGIGLAIGTGFYLGGIITTLLAGASLFLLEKLEKKFISPRVISLEVRIIDRPGQLGAICTTIGRHGASIYNIELERADNNEEAIVTIALQIEGLIGKRPEGLLEDLRSLPGVSRLAWR